MTETRRVLYFVVESVCSRSDKGYLFWIVAYLRE